VTPDRDEVEREVERARQLVRGLEASGGYLDFVSSGDDGRGPCGTGDTLARLLAGLSISRTPAPSGAALEVKWQEFPIEQRQQRQLHQLDRHKQWMLRESPYVRQKFMEQLDTSSLAEYRESVEWYRDYFRDEVIGHFDDPLLPPRPRSRKAYDRPGWTGYEVMLDVFPDVFAYGILLVPKNIPPGERRPVVVCQHGLEGRPQQVVEGDHRAYHDFAARLAERGFVTFAPQNIYIFGDRFRTLQRALLHHGAATSADHRLAGLAAVRRLAADCLLRFVVRRQERHAHPATGGSLLPVYLFCRF
jgi:hypothetical protein